MSVAASELLPQLATYYSLLQNFRRVFATPVALRVAAFTHLCLGPVTPAEQITELAPLPLFLLHSSAGLSHPLESFLDHAGGYYILRLTRPLF